MEIQGIIKHVLPEKTGTGQNGVWVSQSWVLETQEQYPKMICFEAFNKHFNINEGDDVTISINIESREWESKWFTKISAWKVEFNSKAADSGQTSAPASVPENSGTESPNETDDLPFG